MKGRLYAEFMERRGRHIFEGAGCYWYEVPGRMLMSIPYQDPIDPPLEAIHELLGGTNHIGVRYLAREGIGLGGGLYVRRKRPFDINSVQNHKRNRMRRALAKCVVREVENTELQAHGLELNLETMLRQGRFDPEFGRERQWRRLVDACYSSPGVKVIGAFVDDALAAYAVTFEEEGWLHILHQFSANRWLDEYFPNDAIVFTVTKQGMDNPDMEGVTYGVAGLVRGEKLHDFKLRNGYEFVPYGYAFVLRPPVNWLLTNPVLASAIQRAHRLLPRVQLLERVASVSKGARLTMLADTVVQSGALTEDLRYRQSHNT